MKLESPRQMTASQQFVQFIAALSERDVPASVLERAQAYLIDSLGCGLFGASESWTQMMTANTLAESATGRCTLLGGSPRLAPAPAALVNGTAIHGYELDDVISEAISHPGAVVVPAALATAEHVDAPGSRLLLGIVAGYETLRRLGLALGMEPSHRGFHMTGILGPIAAVVAAGVTLRLPFEKLLAAIGLACSASSGLRAFAGGHGGGMVKRLHTGRSAEAGVRMCQLAQRGFTGPGFALDGKFGLLDAFAGKAARPDQFIDGLGESWAVEDVWVKVYPVCAGIQAVVQLLQELRGSTPLAADAVKKIRVGISSFAVNNNGDPAPADTMAAQYSIPYSAAVAVLADPGDPTVFAESALTNPATRRVIDTVELYGDPEADATHPRKRGARVELHLANGEVRTGAKEDAHGTPADPCTDAEIEAKFRRLAGNALSANGIDRVLAAIRTLRDAPSVETLSNALRI